jgi:HlyD family secretion protein
MDDSAPKSSNVKKIVYLLATVCIATGGVWYYLHGSTRAQLHEKLLTFAMIEKTTMRDVVSATGIVRLPEILLISADLPGQIHALHANVNDLVAPGAILARLDDRRARLAVEEANNQVKTAEAALEQAKSLRDAADKAHKVQVDLEKQGGFRAEREQSEAAAKAAKAGVAVAEAKLDSAQTGLKQALLALSQLEIRVPLDAAPPGRKLLVLDRKANEGQIVGPQAGPLFTLAADLGIVEIHAQVAEGDIAKVRKGLDVLFNARTFNDDDKEFIGKVKNIQPLANNLKGAVYYDTVIEVANAQDPSTGEWLLRPGMTISLDIVRRENKDVWRVPSAALNFTLPESYQNQEARAQLADGKRRANAGDWYPIWLWSSAKQSPYPVFVRIGGADAAGLPGMKDSEGNQILEWEPGREPKGNDPFRVIIGSPPGKPAGLFDQPANIKVS